MIKGQALVDFIAEFTYSNAAEVTGIANSAEVTRVRERKNSVPTDRDAEQWTLYVDGASNNIRSRADMMLISPEVHKIQYAICFRFEVSNNEAEYEALIAGLCLACKLQVRNVKIFNDSQLVVNQVNDIYLERG